MPRGEGRDRNRGIEEEMEGEGADEGNMTVSYMLTRASAGE